MNREIRIYCQNQETANMYLVYVGSVEAIIVDPSFISKTMDDTIEHQKLNIKGIFLTHGHFDHFMAAKFYQQKYQCPLYLHEDDISLIDDPRKNCSIYRGKSLILDAEPTAIYDGEVFKFENSTLEVLHTPFHTSGSCCFLIKEQHLLLSGDTLFYRTIGRSDLPSSESSKIESSLSKLRWLDDQYPLLKVYPGHGKTTSLHEEIAFNSYFK